MDKAFIINGLDCLKFFLNNDFIYEGESISGAYFFSFSRYIKDCLENKGVSCYLLDDMISHEEAHRYTDHFLKLSNSWFRDSEGRDVFEYRGVPVAECCMSDFIGSKLTFFHRCFYLLESVFNKFNIDKVLVDSPQYYIISNCCQILKKDFHPIDYATKGRDESSLINEIAQYDFKEVAGQYKESFHRKIIEPVFNFYKKLFGRNYKKNIVISLYFNNLPMINNCDSFEYEKFCIHLLNAPIKKAKLIFDDFRIVSMRSNDFFDRAARYSESHIEEILTNINKNFYINGHDFSNFFINEIIAFINEAIPKLYNIVDSFYDYFSEKEISSLIIPFDCTYVERALMYILSKKRARIIKLQHAIFPIKYLTDIYFNKSDDVFVFSLNNAHFFEGSRVRFLPSPLYDNYYKFDKPEKNKSGPKKILINPFHSVGYMFFMKMYNEEGFLFDVIDVLKKYGDSVEIIIRMHPSISSRYFKRLLNEKYPDVKIHYSTERYFQDAIRDIDLYISSLSTSIYESAAAGVPILYYNNIKLDFLAPFNLSNIDLPQALNVDELNKLIDNFFSSSDSRGWFIDKDVVSKYGVYKDGKNSSKLWKTIAKLISE